MDDWIMTEKPKPRFTLRTVLIVVGVISVLLAGCMGLVGLITMEYLAAQRMHCANRLRMMGNHLCSYQNTHGNLPPAYLMDDNGRPLMSWRVRAAEYEWYDYDFQANMDFSQPWDSPTNSRFLHGLRTEWLRCPSSKNGGTAITDYVAVVGPGTLWQEGPNKISDSEKRILVIEWPKSDIHWAEPRDITVDELLSWLESKPSRTDTNHSDCLQYVDGAGEVGELQLDSDLETVRRLLVGETPPTPTPPNHQSR